MIADLKPYQEYSESGLTWLDAVPVGWKCLRGKSVFSMIDERSKVGTEELLTVSSNFGVIPRRTTSVTMFKAKSYVSHKLCWPGDLVVNSLWAWMQGLGVARHHGLISSAYSVYRPRTDYIRYSDYFHYLLRSAAYKWELQTRSKGVWISRLQLSDLAFMDMPVLLPPPDEQAAIVRFLNHVNHRIERTIKAKRKVIALLNEQKQVIIHRAVTRGLDPNVKLKPSGIPWLGDIPEHWEVTPFKYISHRIQNGATPSTSEQGYYENGTIPWYGPSSIRHDVDLGDAVRYLNTSAFKSGKARLINGPAILVVVIGATAARLALMRGQGATNQQITSFELNTDLYDPDYCVHLLRQAENWLRSTASTATIPILDSGILERLPVACPLLDEQKAISNHIREVTLPLDKCISNTEREIELLREYRTRLTSDVVTGKLDVRAAAAGLPDEVDVLDDEPAEDDDVIEEVEE